MPIIICQGLRFANPLAPAARKGSGCLAAVFCLIAALCATPVGAEPEAAKTEGIQAEVQDKGGEATGSGGQGALRALVPKRKVAVVQFDVVNTQHVDDINNIYDGLPLALSGRLEASGGFLTAYTARPIPAEAGEAQRKAIAQIAEEAGAQFLVSGMVVNAGISQEKRSLEMPFGWSMKVPFSGYKKRHIEIELAVYDGLTGARLLLHRLADQVQGEVRVGNDKPFGSSIFFETEFGKVLNRLIDLAVRDVHAAVENVPFSAHIIRVEEKKVVIDAGSDSLLKSGDKLVAYIRDASAPMVGLKGSVLGVTEQAADIVTLTRVQPQFSTGELSEDAARFGIRAGNIARIDPLEQRKLEAKQTAAHQMAKARQEALEEAERVRAEQAAQAEAARAKAEQAAKAEADRIEAEKKAQAQAAAEARAAKLKARQEAKTARISAAQEARAREQARVRAAAEARTAKLKARQEAKAQAERIRAEKKPGADAQVADTAGTPPSAEVAATGTRTTPETAADTQTTQVKTEPVVTLKPEPVAP